MMIQSLLRCTKIPNQSRVTLARALSASAKQPQQQPQQQRQRVVSSLELIKLPEPYDPLKGEMTMMERWSSAIDIDDLRSATGAGKSGKDDKKKKLIDQLLEGDDDAGTNDAQRVYVRTVDKHGRAHGFGRRKESHANVFIKEGNGFITINSVEFARFSTEPRRSHVLEPFLAVDQVGKFDVEAVVTGGGETGQAGAIRLAISRALQNFNPEWRPLLKKEGLLTRDARVVERKKPGQAKARKKYQWVKR